MDLIDVISESMFNAKSPCAALL